ncbi:Aste57867_11833 [Aphanomyces stellatus]|uniref:Aste57867_11833 protein n=1 Tax=Aphanomyces stellatus TaxID=120398 RepID=A0A485KUG7_9STRA|nr:hypothetical protein As57867_011788 [Aphanomyces stellatus]VFT88688.1 Aste57867_11833 [Aphanomyces stellatus]
MASPPPVAAALTLLADHICLFKDCQQPSVDASGKCLTHKHRLQCITPGCRNQAYARQLCVRHGGKRLCRHPSCTGNARSHGFCCKHGGKSSKKMCEEAGCSNVAHARQRCVRHGGGRKCSIDDCTSYSRYSGYCQRHFSLSNLSWKHNQENETRHSPSAATNDASPSSRRQDMDMFRPMAAKGPCAWKDAEMAFPAVGTPTPTLPPIHMRLYL